nr:unnamed protein product [Callosobruchus analis]
MAMTSSQVKQREQQQNNMANLAGSGTGWPRRNSQNNANAPVGTPNFEVKSNFDVKPFPVTPAINRIINL